MKGTITSCLAKMVKSTAGESVWNEIMDDADVGKDRGVLEVISANIDDAVAIRLLLSTCKLLKLSMEEACDAFGEYWCCTYAPATYAAIYEIFTDARSMIIGVDALHKRLVKNVANAMPPHFDFSWQDKDTLLVTYNSHRNLLDVYCGLARGVGLYYKEPVTVTKLLPNQALIRFAA